MFGSFGMLEIGLILLVGVFVFGAMKLPRLAKNISSGWGELKRLKRGFDLGLDDDDDEQAPRQQAQNYGTAQGQYNHPNYHGNPGQQGFAPDQQMNQQVNTNQYYGQQEPFSQPQKPPSQGAGSAPSSESAEMGDEGDKKSS